MKTTIKTKKVIETDREKEIEIDRKRYRQRCKYTYLCVRVLVCVRERYIADFLSLSYTHTYSNMGHKDKYASTEKD